MEFSVQYQQIKNATSELQDSALLGIQDLKKLEIFIDNLQTIYQSEKEFSKSLEKNLNGIKVQLDTKNIIDSTAKIIYNLYKFKLQQSKESVQILKHEILSTLKNLHKGQTNELKCMKEIFKKVEKEFVNFHENIKNQRKNVNCKIKDYELEIIPLKCSNILQENGKKKIQLKIDNIKQQILKFELNDYKHWDLDTLMDSSTKNLKITYQELIQQEDERAKALKDSIEKLLGVFMILSKSIGVHVDTITQHMELLETNRQVPDLMKLYLRNSLPDSEKQIKYTGFIYNSLLKDNFQKQEDDNLNNIEIFKLVFNHQLEDTYDSKKEEIILSLKETQNLQQLDILEYIEEFSSIIVKAWKGLLPKENFSILKKFESLVKNKMSLQYFYNALCLFRIKNRLSLEDDSYNNMIQICQIILNQCYQLREVQCARKLIIFSLTFYKQIDINGTINKIFLQQAIKSHHVWKILQFWECVIIHSIDEQIQSAKNNQIYQNSEPQDIINSKKIVITGILLTNCINMASFGLREDDIKTIIARFVKYFKLTQEQKQTLINCINQNCTQQNLQEIILDELYEQSKDKKQKSEDNSPNIIIRQQNKALTENKLTNKKKSFDDMNGGKSVYQKTSKINFIETK